MSDSSRRGFLGTLLSSATLAAAACGGSPAPPAATSGAAPPPSSSPTAGPSGTAPRPAGPPPHVPIDLKIASHFCGRTSKFDVAPGVPFLAANLYGLVLADAKNSELLVPNSHHASLPGSHLHRARLYSTAVLKTGAPDNTDTRLDTGEKLPYWSLEGYQVTFAPLDSGGKPPSAPGAKLKIAARPAQPWGDIRYIRNICTMTGKPLLLPKDRADATLIAARVDLRDGVLEAGAPFTPIGMFSEWFVTTSAGKQPPRATTDNMIAVWQFPAGTIAVRVTFTPVDGSAPAKAPVELLLKDDRLAVAITHATPAPPGPPAIKLEDTRAFALLLQKGDPATFPVPEFERGAHGEARPDYGSLATASGTDTHCDCAICN